MSKIGISTIYGDVYSQDRLFDPTACTLSENLLIPNIRLREKWMESGHTCHTVDMYGDKQIDCFVFMDVPHNSILIQHDFISVIKYILKRKWRTDYLLKSVRQKQKARRFLILNEPPAVNVVSYDSKYHKWFERVFTWCDDILGEEKYVKFYYPEVKPAEKYQVEFKEKKKLVLIASNKTSDNAKELYSQRKKAIEYYQEKDEIDLYGIGWKKEDYKCYRGSIEKKFEVLQNYKYCICYENMYGINGYITEKIFDCFFSHCVPVYWGADNVTDYIPQDTFIDMRNFSSYEQLDEYLESITEEQYNEYLYNIDNYLNSEKFKMTFSVDNYVKILSSNIEV